NAVLDEIEAMADLLVDFPKLGRLIDDTNLRYIVTRKYRYRIVYRLEQSELRIVQVLHPLKE
ncbi:MAG: type II toxin-antitoxin system RelE/ParE family toxin, partial [Pseudomonadota bacterium]